MYNVHNAYTCKFWKELPPVNLVVATCDSCKRMTNKLVPRSIIVCSTGPSAARGVIITRVYWPLPLWTGTGRTQLVVWCSQPPDGKIFWLILCSRKILIENYCTYHQTYSSKCCFSRLLFLFSIHCYHFPYFLLVGLLLKYVALFQSESQLSLRVIVNWCWVADLMEDC